MQFFPRTPAREQVTLLSGISSEDIDSITVSCIVVTTLHTGSAQNTKNMAEHEP